MVRICMDCGAVYGCVGKDGKKFKCRGCPFITKCRIRGMTNNRDSTHGLCDECFKMRMFNLHFRKLVAKGI